MTAAVTAFEFVFSLTDISATTHQRLFLQCEVNGDVHSFSIGVLRLGDIISLM